MLKKGQKEVFEMYVLDGLTHKEIGKITKCAKGNSQSQLSRGRSKLRSILKKMNYELSFS